MPTRIIEAHLSWILEQRPAAETALAAEYRALHPVWAARPMGERYAGEKRCQRGVRWVATP